MVTIAEIVKEMKNEGYKISPTTIKYYIDIGLMPQPDKIGGYGAGVKLSFPNRAEALSRLKKIYELKGKGYKLSEIKETLCKLNIDDLKKLNKKFMEQYIEMDGQFFHLLKDPEGYQEYTYENLKHYIDSYDKIFMGDIEVNTPFSVPENLLEESFLTINDLELFYPSLLYQDKLMIDERQYSYIITWMVLRHEYDIDWDTQEDLFKKHKENMDNKYWFWPKPDNVRFSKAEIEVRKRNELNKLSGLILSYLIDAKDDYFRIEGDSGWSIRWDYPYDNINIFISEFLEGKCAFVQESYVDFTTFLCKL